MKNTDTPRTDEESVNHIGFYSCATVPSSFARKLERELNASQAEVERLTKLLSLEREGHEGTKKLCAKILDSTRKTPSMEWHRKNRKVLLK
jgi:hypothetical protein